MEQNKKVREGIANYLRQEMPESMIKEVYNGWTLLDGAEDTPTLLVHINDGDVDSEYFGEEECYRGMLTVSVYLGQSSSDDELDDIGERIKELLPIGCRIPDVVRLYREGFSYERSESGAYRALHINHAYKWG